MCRGMFATDDKFSKHMKGLKTGGRQKGTPNKITAENREFLSNLFSENYELIQQDFLWKNTAPSEAPTRRVIMYSLQI